ncbi:MAG: hypothetical protein ACM3RP_03235 [Chitinophagales bacterium]
MRTRNHGLTLALLLGLLTFASVPALAAFEVMGGKTTVVLDKARTVKGDLYAAGQSVIVDGTVTGDLVTAARTIIVNGRVDGSILAAGNEITLNGPVGENIRAAGATVTVTNKAGRNASLAGSDVVLTSGAELGGGLLAGATRLEVQGKVTDDVLAGGETVVLGGKVGGGVRADVGRLEVGPEAEVGGKVVYRSPQEASVPGSAKLHGGVQFERRASRSVTVNWHRAGQVINAAWFLGILVLGVILWLVYPERLQELTVPVQRTWTRGFLYGLLGLVAGPLAIGLAFASFIGIPIAILLLGLYVSGLLFTQPLAGSLVARQVMARYFPERTLHPALVTALGMAGLFLLGLVPFLGPLVHLLALVLGFGLLVGALQPGPRTTGCAPESE